MNKRVHEIAKERGIPTKEVISKLQAAGLDVTAASSSVDEQAAGKALAGAANGGQASAPSRPTATPDDPSGSVSAGPSGSVSAAPSSPPATAPPKRAPTLRRVAIDPGVGGSGRSGRSGGRSGRSGSSQGRPSSASEPSGRPSSAAPAPPSARRALPVDPRRAAEQAAARSGQTRRASAGRERPSGQDAGAGAATTPPSGAAAPAARGAQAPDARGAQAPEARSAPAQDASRSGAPTTDSERGARRSDPRRSQPGRDVPPEPPRRTQQSGRPADSRRGARDPRTDAPRESGRDQRQPIARDPRQALPRDPRRDARATTARGAQQGAEGRQGDERRSAAAAAAAEPAQRNDTSAAEAAQRNDTRAAKAAQQSETRATEAAQQSDARSAEAAQRSADSPAAEGTQASRAASADQAARRPTRDSLQGERAPGNAGGRRRVVIDSQASRRAGGPGGGGPAGGPNQPPRRQRRGRRRRGVYDEEAESRPSQPLDTGPAKIQINSGSTVKDVAEYLDVSTSEIIKKLMGLGELRTLTQTLSDDTIELLAVELGKEVEIVHSEDEDVSEPEFDDADEDLVQRAPVVTIMGHVDHGKTSLLDAIRETQVAAGEAGGITQHIGAYQVAHDGHTVTFLDTPGHEAFTAMRARGARVTDLAVIVVAADDGVKPQTQEAVDHAKEAGVPMLVAVNKVDKEGAQPDRVRTEMTQLGLQPVEWGGDTEFVNVSAKTREGLDDLLETIILMSEVEDLKANPDAPASGSVIESKLDPGRGPVVTILVSRGTLGVGDALVAGAAWGRVRAMHDHLGKRLTEALPGQPVEVLGFDGVPEAGEHVRAVEHERRARQLAMERATRLKAESLARVRSGKRVSLENIFGSDLQELNLVVKADVAGSLEAIEDEIAKLPQDEVSVNVIRRAVGAVTESDVMLAAASEAVILAFNVRPVGDARAVAEREGVEIRAYSVIYRAIEELRQAMQGMLAPEEVEDALGTAEVRQIFRASRVGTIAGSYVTDGTITRGSKVRLVRDGTVIWDGQIQSLRRFNDDVREVASNFECGIVLRDYADIKEGDVLETYTTRQVERELA